MRLPSGERRTLHFTPHESSALPDRALDVIEHPSGILDGDELQRRIERTHGSGEQQHPRRRQGRPRGRERAFGC
jgi:hypothetical protein